MNKVKKKYKIVKKNSSQSGGGGAQREESDKRYDAPTNIRIFYLFFPKLSKLTLNGSTAMTDKILLYIKQPPPLAINNTKKQSFSCQPSITNNKQWKIQVEDDKKCIAAGSIIKRWFGDGLILFMNLYSWPLTLIYYQIFNATIISLGGNRKRKNRK